MLNISYHISHHTTDIQLIFIKKNSLKLNSLLFLILIPNFFRIQFLILFLKWVSLQGVKKDRNSVSTL